MTRFPPGIGGCKVAGKEESTGCVEKWRRSGCQAPVAQIGLRWTPIALTKDGLRWAPIAHIELRWAPVDHINVHIFTTDNPSAVLAITAVPLLNRTHFGRCVISC